MFKYFRNNSMLALAPENNSNQKISEEITRFVCLANTVLGTKLPELSCCCTDQEVERARAALRATFDANDIPTPINLIKNSCVADTSTSAELTEAKITALNMIEKHNEYEGYSFIEDESGFSSMSSFQEIGIPIISIIPASPCEEVCAGATVASVPPAPAEGNTTATSTAASVHVFWV